MNISIMMSVWCQNLWDELILKNEIQIFKKKYWEDTIFNVFTYDLDNIFYNEKNINYLEYAPIWIKNPRNILRNIKNFFKLIKTIKKSDLVVFWWWWIFFDNEVGSFSNPLFRFVFRSKLVKFFGKKLIIYWVSIDINKQKSYKQISSIFKKADEIYVRDKHSFLLLKKLNIDSIIIKDPVFYDNWFKNNENKLIKKIPASIFDLTSIKDIDFSNKIVWIAFRSGYLWWGNEKKEKQIIKDIIDFILQSNWKVILLPHSFHKIDSKANDYEFLKWFIWDNIEIKSDMKSVYEIYKKNLIDICLSMRLHSMILCQVYGIEYIGVSYSKKTEFYSYKKTDF